MRHAILTALILLTVTTATVNQADELQSATERAADYAEGMQP